MKHRLSDIDKPLRQSVESKKRAVQSLKVCALGLLCEKSGSLHSATVPAVFQCVISRSDATKTYATPQRAKDRSGLLIALSPSWLNTPSTFRKKLTEPYVDERPRKLGFILGLDDLEQF
jgi:hypothetical protein